MTVVHNRPNDVYRAAIGKARKDEDRRLDRKKRGVVYLRHVNRYKTPEQQQRYHDVIAENRRIGAPPPTPRDEKFKGLPRKSQRKMAVALTPTQIKEANRGRLAAIVARKAVVNAAVSARAAADAEQRARKRHIPGPMNAVANRPDLG